jgi:HAD superfamily hydrolase (TIGR01459 family)
MLSLSKHARLRDEQGLTENFPMVSAPPVILSGLSEIADAYDALLCDVWGVVHDGRSGRAPAVDALRAFRSRRGPVVLLSNAPRPVEDVQKQFSRLGVPEECYDVILTSGVLAREELARRAAKDGLKILHIGPERDRGIFAGLSVACVGAEEAEVVLCTGLFDDETETPADYRGMLADLERRGLNFLCANPDIVVQRGGQLIYCAGALARLYKQLGGACVYFGKPHPPIYQAALCRLRELARSGPRVLALGDGLETDIRGANAAGLDAVFIVDGIHGEDIPEMTPEVLARLFAQTGVAATGAMRTLVW